MIASHGTTAEVPRQGSYVPELDGLRAISILMVMLGHTGYQWVPAVLGVTLFFVISGYLICGMLLREVAQSGSLKLRTFYAKRMLRLYPELLVYLLVLVLCCHLLGWSYLWIQLAAGVFYFTNYLQIYGHAGSTISIMTRPLWSLAVEEHFYLIFPLLLLALRGSARRIALVLSLTIVAVGLLRALVFHLWTVPEFYFGYATESQIDAVCGGCLLACIAQGAHYARILRAFETRSVWLLSSGLLMISAALFIRNPEWRSTWRYTAEGIGSTLLVGSILWGRQLDPLRALLSTRALVYLGRLSYAAYLYHLLVYQLVQRVIPHDTVEFKTSAIVLSFAAAALSFILIETPIRPLRRRLGSDVPVAASSIQGYAPRLGGGTEAVSSDHWRPG